MNNQDIEKVKNRFKNFSPEKKIELSLELYYSARELKRASIKAFNPSWDDNKIENELRKIFIYART